MIIDLLLVRCLFVRKSILVTLFLVLLATVTMTSEVIAKLDVIASHDLSNVTIKANNETVSSILEVLRTKYSIDVRPQNFKDSVVSVNIENAPLEEAIGHLLPKGTRYVLRTGDREVVVPMKSIPKKLGNPEKREDGLPTKDKTLPLPENQRIKIKVDPKKWQPPNPHEGGTLKPVSEKVANVPLGKGQKKTLSQTIKDRSIRFSFIITSKNNVRLQHAALVDGTLSQSNIVRGNFLFTLKDPSDRIVHFGSFQDPLEIHSYREDGTHDVNRAKEGSFGIWVPENLELSNLVLEIFDARKVSLPVMFDEKSLETAIHSANRIAQIKGDLLQKIISEGDTK